MIVVDRWSHGAANVRRFTVHCAAHLERSTRMLLGSELIVVVRRIFINCRLLWHIGEGYMSLLHDLVGTCLGYFLGLKRERVHGALVHVHVHHLLLLGHTRANFTAHGTQVLTWKPCLHV